MSVSDAHPLVLAARILLAQTVVCYLAFLILLFAEGMIHFGARVAFQHALERAVIGGVVLAVVVTLSRLKKAKRGSGISARSILGVERFDIPLPMAASASFDIQEKLQSVPGVGNVIVLGDQSWGVVLKGPARWLARVHVTVTGDRLAVVEAAPRHPFFLPAGADTRTVGALTKKLGEQ
ncbi:hypothetical protein PV396_42795 [Streptomyces sp. ME02-8801-2C]|uniref:hypothetical protein n=1 Tax=Streptomyces sp. ME02-8801-2C TaxID=3028680 RepID=UPI0029B71B4B|nr:hypothetical protein [Streptomyces sp. ME02-8801-2C]MDX3458586.1 hypothetical protein [Streptomyces sp. ME02-8801-2C]